MFKLSCETFHYTYFANNHCSFPFLHFQI